LYVRNCFEQWALSFELLPTRLFQKKSFIKFALQERVVVLQQSLI
jgi:hypothetical protein